MPRAWTATQQPAASRTAVADADVVVRHRLARADPDARLPGLGFRGFAVRKPTPHPLANSVSGATAATGGGSGATPSPGCMTSRPSYPSADRAWGRCACRETARSCRGATRNGLRHRGAGAPTRRPCAALVVVRARLVVVARAARVAAAAIGPGLCERASRAGPAPGSPCAGPAREHYSATMPSPPAAPGTMTEPMLESVPSALTLNSSTAPLRPAWT